MGDTLACVTGEVTLGKVISCLLIVTDLVGSFKVAGDNFAVVCGGTFCGGEDTAAKVFAAVDTLSASITLALDEEVC